MAQHAVQETEAHALVESIRDEIHAFDYVKLSKAEVDVMHTATEDAVEDAASEGVYRTPDLQALHVRLIQERASQDARDFAVERFMYKTVAALGLSVPQTASWDARFVCA